MRAEVRVWLSAMELDVSHPEEPFFDSPNPRIPCEGLGEGSRRRDSASTKAAFSSEIHIMWAGVDFD